MFSKILIANRGEIAVRVIKAARDLGIRTAAVYSEADAKAKFVELADEAHLLGAAPVAQSYLNIPKIVDIAKNSRVEAVHPGYGLLSENPKFAQALLDAGIVFIGPSPKVLDCMGHKSQAKEIMRNAGVPVVPGSKGVLSGLEEARAFAIDSGFPVMIKAAAGGGGIGLARVYSQEQLEGAYANAERTAKTYFGNGELFIEKFLDGPRHIEVQIFGDQSGNICHLFERECSIQRRHQKIIEETPSCALMPELRNKICEAGVKAAKAVNYVGAGTVEFLLDSGGNFYFLEMNTRLQVEHPITEMTTGIDLVKEQFLVASGETLSFVQSGLKQFGHAIECRICAEDPNTFMPSPGKITNWQEPGGDGIRLDSGFRAEDSVSIFYDPMLAKLIAHGKNREEARLRMIDALNSFVIEGVKSNISRHLAILRDEKFIDGKYDVTFLRA